MNEVMIYQSSDKQTKIDVRFEGDTVWLSQQQMASLFKQTKQNISLHLNNCYKEKELNRKSTVKYSLTVRNEGNRLINRKIEYYNLDVIISVGYRVKSKQGTQFRQWATQRLRDFLVKGYAINEQSLKASAQQLADLKKSMKLLENVVQQKQLSSDEAIGLLQVVTAYARALDLLDQYDHQRLVIPETKKVKLQSLPMPRRSSRLSSGAISRRPANFLAMKKMNRFTAPFKLSIKPSMARSSTLVCMKKRPTSYTSL